MVELEVLGVVAQPLSDEHKQGLLEQAEALAERPGPVVVDLPEVEHQIRLKERTGERVLQFCIGAPEAAAIALVLQGDVAPRPMTHDLIGNLVRALDDVSVLRVVITKQERDRFYAQVELRHRERPVIVDCRPSDGIAVALRLGVPIVAADELDPILAAA